jgi:hypothetical protein
MAHLQILTGRFAVKESVGESAEADTLRTFK